MNGRPKTGDEWNFILLATSADLGSLFSKVCRSPVLPKRGEHAVKQTNNNKKKKKSFSAAAAHSVLFVAFKTKMRHRHGGDLRPAAH
jgi:hypothetical protein